MSIEKKYIEDVLHPFIRPHNNQFSSKGRGRAGIIMMMDNDGKGILARIPRPNRYDNDVHNVYAVRHGPCAPRPYSPLPDRPIAPPRRTTGHCRAIPAKQVSRPFARPPHSMDTKKPTLRSARFPLVLYYCAPGGFTTCKSRAGQSHSMPSLKKKICRAPMYPIFFVLQRKSG